MILWLVSSSAVFSASKGFHREQRQRTPAKLGKTTFKPHQKQAQSCKSTSYASRISLRYVQRAIWDGVRPSQSSRNMRQPRRQNRSWISALQAKHTQVFLWRGNLAHHTENKGILKGFNHRHPQKPRAALSPSRALATPTTVGTPTTVASPSPWPRPLHWPRPQSSRITETRAESAGGKERMAEVTSERERLMRAGGDVRGRCRWR